MEIRNLRDVAAQVMTKSDQVGLIVRNVINKDDTGARRIILLSAELPPGTVHLLHRHPNAEQIMYVLEGSCLSLSEGEPVRLNEGDAVFIAQGEWHGVRNDTDQPAVTLVIYAGAGSLEEAGYEEQPRQFEQAYEEIVGKEESVLQESRRCVVHGLSTPLDPNPHATPGNSGQSKEQESA